MKLTVVHKLNRYERGSVVDLPAAYALDLLTAGYATLIKEPQEGNKEISTPVPPKRRGKAGSSRHNDS